MLKKLKLLLSMQCFLYSHIQWPFLYFLCFLFKQINGSLARRAIKDLMAKGAIRIVSVHSSQQMYTRATNTWRGDSTKPCLDVFLCFGEQWHLKILFLVFQLKEPSLALLLTSIISHVLYFIPFWGLLLIYGICRLWCVIFLYWLYLRAVS